MLFWQRGQMLPQTNRVKHFALLGVLLALCTGGLKAAPIIGSSTGLESPAYTITFSEVTPPSGTLLSDEFAAFGITTANLYYDPFPTYPELPSATAGNFDSATTDACGEEQPCSPFSIYFITPQRAAAFQIVTLPGSTSFTALRNGVVVESFTATTLAAPAFYGFTGVVFDQIYVDTAGISNGAALIDNVQLAPVPEPSSWLLLATGIGLVGFARKRRASARK